MMTDFMFAEVSLNLGNMKCIDTINIHIRRINTINIHSEKRSLEEFMKKLEDENQEYMTGNLAANYRKLHDGFSTREANPVPDDEAQIVDSYVCSISSNLRD